MCMETVPMDQHIGEVHTTKIVTKANDQLALTSDQLFVWSNCDCAVCACVSRALMTTRGEEVRVCHVGLCATHLHCCSSSPGLTFWRRFVLSPREKATTRSHRHRRRSSPRQCSPGNWSWKAEKCSVLPRTRHTTDWCILVQLNPPHVVDVLWVTLSLYSLETIRVSTPQLTTKLQALRVPVLSALFKVRSQVSAVLKKWQRCLMSWFRRAAFSACLSKSMPPKHLLIKCSAESNNATNAFHNFKDWCLKQEAQNYQTPSYTPSIVVNFCNPQFLFSLLNLCCNRGPLRCLRFVCVR